MKIIRFWFCVVFVALTGCSHSYVMKLSNGNKIVTSSKPTLDKSVYVYKDAKGDKHYVPQGRVVEISPASMANDDSSKFKGPKAK